ncbi:hypothetical protein MRX96_053899, partial [Rhipicephalus microplus]
AKPTLARTHTIESALIFGAGVSSSATFSLETSRYLGTSTKLSAQVACLPAALPLPPTDAERFLEAGLPYDDRRPDIERLRERERLPER